MARMEVAEVNLPSGNLLRFAIGNGPCIVDLPIEIFVFFGTFTIG